MTRAMTRDDILTAFELLLDRAPAPAHLDQMLAQGITLPQLRRMILGSEEFCEIHAALRAQPAGPVPSRAGLPGPGASAHPQDRRHLVEPQADGAVPAAGAHRCL